MCATRKVGDRRRYSRHGWPSFRKDSPGPGQRHQALRGLLTIGEANKVFHERRRKLKNELDFVPDNAVIMLDVRVVVRIVLHQFLRTYSPIRRNRLFL